MMHAQPLGVQYDGRNAEGLHEFRSPGLTVQMTDENIDTLRSHPELNALASLVYSATHLDPMTGQG